MFARRLARAGWWFRLRTLLIAVVVVAGLCAWLGTRFRFARLQAEAARTIASVNGYACYDAEFADSGEQFSSTPPGMGAMHAAFREPSEPGLFSDIVAVDLSYFNGPRRPVDWPIDGPIDPLVLSGIEMIRPIENEDLKCLAGLSRLKWLRLENTNVSDAGLRYLERFSRLQWLSLRNTKVTDGGVKELQNKLPRCEIVR